MDQESIQPILQELFSSLEPLETQSDALLQFLKAKGLATDEELAPFLEQAANTASVRWRAVRVRTAALIANLLNLAEEESFAKPSQSEERRAADNGQPEPQQQSLNETQAKEESESEEKSTPGEQRDVTSEREETTQAAEKAA